MKIQNIHIMKQPDLGKKLAELRKQNGLTQEELVEKCNISVRTIQRIEAGEVEPRSYTIKTILNALNIQFDSVFEKKYKSGYFDKIFGISLDSSSRLKQLTIAWIFGIVYFFIGFFEVGFEFNRFFGDDLIGGGIGYILVKCISLISFVLFMRGFVIVGSMYKSYLLQIMTVIIIVFMVLIGFYDIFTFDSVSYIDELDKFTGISKAITSGILQILFGIAILQLSSKIGNIASVSGVFEIITGIFFLSVIGAIVGLFFLIPTEILEIIVLYKVAEKLKKEDY